MIKHVQGVHENNEIIQPNDSVHNASVSDINFDDNVDMDNGFSITDSNENESVNASENGSESDTPGHCNRLSWILGGLHGGKGYEGWTTVVRPVISLRNGEDDGDDHSRDRYDIAPCIRVGKFLSQVHRVRRGILRGLMGIGNDGPPTSQETAEDERPNG